ncbi:MAG TPA: hypothetical protein VFG81_18745 [Anaerolineales bacterium]|jgi:hypothetical protein|nr:hypothetical protein [Anaerolineales bacterium]
MKNPGMDLKIWKSLKSKWADLDSKGYKVKIDFQLIAHPNDAKRILAIDVVQHIDGKPVIETVQRSPGEGYVPLGIAGLSQESLHAIYKQMMKQLREQSTLNEIDVIVVMSPTSFISGELKGHLEVPDAPVQSSILLDYRHYYVLNALRDRMSEQSGRSWTQVSAVYHSGDLEFHFEYS